MRTRGRLDRSHDSHDRRHPRRVIGPASAKVVDGTGQTWTVIASPTGDAVQLDVNVPSGTTFSITSTVVMDTLAPTGNEKGEAPPNPTPPSSKKAIIKPVTQCPP